MSSGEKVGAMAREWRLVLAGLALLSLFLLIPLAPTPQRAGRHDAEELRRIKRLTENRRPEEAERRAQLFLLQRGNSSYLSEAHLRLGQALFARGQGKDAASLEFMKRAWDEIESAREKQQERTSDNEDLRGLCVAELVRIANALRDRGLYREAADKYGFLIDTVGRREVALELATSLALQGLASPDESEGLLTEALGRVNDYLLTAEGEEAAEAHLTRTRIFWRYRKYWDMEKSAAAGLDSFPTSPKASAFRTEHGKALARLKRAEGAIAELERVRGSTTDMALRDEAGYFEAELRTARLDPKGEALAEKLITDRSRYAPLAQLLLGRSYLESHRQDPYASILKGLTATPNVGYLEAENVSLDETYARLNRDWTSRPDSATLTAAEQVLKEMERLYPEEIKFFFDAASLYELAADQRREEASRMDPSEAAPLLRESAELDSKAGHEYQRVSGFPNVSREVKQSSLLNAAKVYYKGGLFDKAARAFRAHFELTTEASSLYWSAMALKEQGIYLSRYVQDHDALGTFGEFLQTSSPTDRLVPSAMLQRGRILMELGRYPEAMDGFDRLMHESQYDLSPDNEAWAEALLLRGKCELETARRAAKNPDLKRRALAEARKTFWEYLERYAEALPAGTHPRAEAISAAFGLGRAAVEEQEWADAVKAFLRAIDLAAVIPPAERAEQTSEVRLANLLLGDSYFNLAQHDKAQRTYENAFRKYSAVDPESRLWTLIGWARSLKKMGKGDEAKGVSDQARTAYDENREAFDAGLGGFGKDYWPAMLRELERELDVK